MKLASFLLAAAMLGAFASGASAAPSSTATAASFCSTSKGAASSILHAGTMPTPTAGASMATLGKQLKALYTRVKASESTVLAQAPGSLKVHFQRVFAFYNMVYDRLAKANWNVMALAQNAQSLQAGAAKVKPDLLAIKKYYETKCGK